MSTGYDSLPPVQDALDLRRPEELSSWEIDQYARITELAFNLPSGKFPDNAYGRDVFIEADEYGVGILVEKYRWPSFLVRTIINVEFPTQGSDGTVLPPYISASRSMIRLIRGEDEITERNIMESNYDAGRRKPLHNTFPLYRVRGVVNRASRLSHGEIV